ncbi:MAG TPA: CerR family C-terminal domain-containing protein [bacterium]|nr:CerR family C-terminal domain-containing protein [bacterium]
MGRRKDGEATRLRILQAAGEVFADKGFHEATHADICRRAEANTAAINYHFGDKEGLYRAVWQNTIELMAGLYPADGGAAADEPAPQRLERFVKTMLGKMTAAGALGHSHRLHLQEAHHPTGIVDDLLAQGHEPYRAYLRAILRELLGPQASDRNVACCEVSVIGQVRAFRHGLHKPPFAKPPHVGAKQIEHLAAHIARFSLAGIAAIRRTND